jgi:hypothetical protein
MRILRGALLVVLGLGLAGCGNTGSSPAPSPVQPPAPQAAPFQVTGFVFDTANRALAGAIVEVLDGPQAGASATAAASGAFSLTGTFDRTTRFRATDEGHVAATRSFDSIATNKSIFFALDVLAGPVNIAGDYTLTFVADSACAGELPSEVRTRTYAATITPYSSSGHPANTLFTAALSGAELDTYYNRMFIFVAGDYLDFDLSDNYLVEEVGPETYLLIAGVGAVSVGRSGVSTISASFKGVFDYCVMKSEPENGAPYRCVPSEAVAHAQCESANHRLILTRR